MRIRFGVATVSLAVLVAFSLSVQRVGGAPPAKGISLTALGAYTTGLFDEGAVEIAAYDPVTGQALMTFAERPFIRGVDITNPNNPQLSMTIDLSPWGPKSTSVAVHDGVLVVAVPNADEALPGKAVFFDTQTGGFLSAVTVGALPDMVTFTPNGEMVLVANEGQPRPDYSFDPEGSVSIIDVRGGIPELTQADVATAGFGAFNAGPLDPAIRIFGRGSSVAQDLEPEYIAVSHDSQTAWVTLQENNAIGIIDLKAKQVTKLVALGAKNHALAGQGLDGSTDDRVFGVKNWPVWGLYMPDAIAAWNYRGRTFLVTANEGDVREYSGLNAPAGGGSTEAVEIRNIALDPTAFPAATAALLKNATAAGGGIGKLKVTAFSGDTDRDGDFDQLFAFGARSFSVWDEDGSLVWDSGDALERITAAAHPSNFNASNTNNTIDNRSDDKGPEPEGATVHKLFGRDYAFIALERIGGIVVYDVSDPTAPSFVQYINVRSFSAAPGTSASGDQGAEGVRVITEEDSPTGEPLLMVSNEVSGSLRLFAISQK